METLVKIKNKDYLNNLIITKYVSIYKEDLNEEQLNKI